MHPGFFKTTIVGAATALILTNTLACDDGVDEKSDGDNFREDVFLCEDAVSHLEQCCPTLQAPLYVCLYHTYTSQTECGCGGGPKGLVYHKQITPALDPESSKTVLDTTCEQMTPDFCAAMNTRVQANNELIKTMNLCGQSAAESL